MKINIHTSHPSAFISSTFLDLQAERAAISATLWDRSINVNALDIRPASNNSSKKEILNGIRESDFLILIVGDRYGSILPSITESSSNSVTMWEYLTASRLGKPVIAYFKSCVENNQKNHDDPSDQDYDLKRKRFEFFKRLVTSRHNPAYFNTTLELCAKVDSALISIYREGVKTLCAENGTLRTKVTELESELSRFKSSPIGLAAASTSPISDLLGGHSTDSPASGLINPLAGLLNRKT